MQLSRAKGSEWRKWDLHVHSPASHNFVGGDYNQFIIQLGNADCAVIGINDYFSVTGYKEVRRRLDDPAAPTEGNQAYQNALEKLREKTLLPVVECRMHNIVVDKELKSGQRINFHIVFSPDVSPDDIETFIKNLKVKNKSISGHYDDPKFLFQSVSVDFFETCQALRGDQTFKDRFLIWLPYDEYGGIDNINPETDAPFKERLVTDADILGSSNKAQADFFLWKDSKFTEDQYRQWFGRRKPCIKGSDSHHVNDVIGKLKDKHSKPTNKHCWVKADPTFAGLRQIINEPEDRVYIGSVPPKLEEVRRSPTRFLSSIHIRKTPSADLDDNWFDCVVPLNCDMVAIIGDKGTGKSALADVLGLVGNTHCDPEHFSFLTKRRFCEKNGRIAKHFEVEGVWEDGSQEVFSLNGRPDPDSVELVKYIPQKYLERICTETEAGEQSEFQQELRKVVFSHVSDADKLGKESLEQLIEYKTEEIADRLNGLREEMSRINGDILGLEAKATAKYSAQIKAELELKQKELAAHLKNKPAPVEKPNSLDPNQQAAFTQIGQELEKERATLSGLVAQIGEQQTRQKTLAEQIEVAKKLETKIGNFEADFDRVKRECAPDLEKLGLNIETMITLTVNTEALTQKRKMLADEKDKVDIALSLTDSASLLSQKMECENRMKALQEKLDQPNKRYQEYQDAVKAWEERKDVIEGDAQKPGSVKFYEALLAYLKDKLPQEISALKERRRTHARKVHKAISSIKEVYGELFAPVQQLIDESAFIKEGFGLTVESSIIERTLRLDFFETYVNQGAAGSFYGKEKGEALFDEIRANYDLSNANDVIAFTEKIISHLQNDTRASPPANMEIDSQLRKHVEPRDLYEFLWGFTYLEPEYSLKLDGKELTQLSPGERGTLLLVFYLLVDQNDTPIIVDQPEENLGSQTVYRLLIPVIKEVKKRRQIIMVTHSPNIAVVCDAEQIIHAYIDRSNKNRVIYTMGAIESPQINKYVIDVLEGTRPAFDNRGSKYYAA